MHARMHIHTLSTQALYTYIHTHTHTYAHTSVRAITPTIVPYAVHYATGSKNMLPVPSFEQKCREICEMDYFGHNATRPLVVYISMHRHALQ